MIISRTPLRISFVGGGSDIASFYQHQPGAVLSTTINKYMYIIINKKFDNKIHVSYSKTEIVDNVLNLKHNLARETLIFMKINQAMEIFPVCDIPSGTGLGTSSAYTVGLLNALYAYKGVKINSDQLAKAACIIEIEKAKFPVGKQDHYAEVYGGINFIQFNPDGSVEMDPIKLSFDKMKQVQNNLLMFYTGVSGSSSKVLLQQRKTQNKRRKILSKMVELTRTLKLELKKGNIDSLGNLMHENWLLKKQLSGNISNIKIDALYEKALKHGATGGKICGAGGRGFLLFYASHDRHKKIISELSVLRNIDFLLEREGSTILLNENQ